MPLEHTLRQPQGKWLTQRSLSSHPRHAYLLKTPERQVCGFWKVTKPTWQNNRKSNYLAGDTLLTTLLTIIGPSDPQVRHPLCPGHVQTNMVSTLHHYTKLSPTGMHTVSTFTIKFQPLRLHMSACYRPVD